MASASNSGLHSESASSQSLLPPKDEQQDVSSQKAPLELKKEETPKEELFAIMDNREEKEKFERYFAEMTDYLTAKYFSDKTMFGGNIYDVKVTTDGQTVKASR
ncbi:OLC1v1013995C3 [Oldenlandia corymbosa var. corymbosa]|nr:OLC1v1013995C3 [Oldenlandia corymbosa var. corymbosa]